MAGTPASSTSLNDSPGSDSRASDHEELIVECAGLGDRCQAHKRVHLLTEKVLSETGRGLNLTQADLSGLDLSGFDLRHAVLNRASLYGTQLAKANLTGASLVCAGMERTDFTEAVVTGAYVHAFAAQASTFTGADMTGLVDSTGALFHGCDLAGARLDDAELAGTTFYQCNLVETRFQGTDLHGAVFNECRMDYAILGRAYLHDAMILRSSIRELNLSHARGHGLVLRRPTAADGLCLTNAHLPGLRLDQVRARRLRAADLHAPGIDVLDCQLPEADFSHADLSGGRWAQVGLDGARLVGALLPDSSWRGVSAINADATQVTAEGLTAGECTFTDAVFIGLAGRYSTFRNCDFHCADLRSAYLYRATFVGDPPTSACLVGAQLDGANLTQAYLAADFTGASIRHGWAAYARVNQAIFERADLRGTSLFRASAVKTEFTGARLGGQYGVVFADRCPGLLDALHESADPASKRVAELVEELSELLTRDAGMST